MSKAIRQVVLLAAVAALAACTRSVGPGGPTSAPTTALGATSPAEATMNAIRSAFLTQTAQAHGATPLVAATPTFVSLATLPLTQAATSAATVVGPSPTVRPLATATFPAIPTATPGVPSSYTLKQDEFPYCIARRFNVDPEELLSLNGLSRTSLYYEGLALRIPQSGAKFPGPRALVAHPATTVVKSGESIYSIACMFGDVDPNAIILANSLTSPYTLTPGSTIRIP
ncbi:MAG: LysM peptidoglycan-binding domain-containing protein [Chloroflexi bacterium]|nr:LysM peptidoglycan-binding domain-containing protein [Chloroflexota bacterium]